MRTRLFVTSAGIVALASLVSSCNPQAAVLEEMGITPVGEYFGPAAFETVIAEDITPATCADVAEEDARTVRVEVPRRTDSMIRLPEVPGMRDHRIWVFPRSAPLVVEVTEHSGDQNRLEVTTTPKAGTKEVWGLMFLDTSDCQVDGLNDLGVAKLLTGTQAAFPPGVFDGEDTTAMGYLIGNSTYVLASPN